MISAAAMMLARVVYFQKVVEAQFEDLVLAGDANDMGSSRRQRQASASSAGRDDTAHITRLRIIPLSST